MFYLPYFSGKWKHVSPFIIFPALTFRCHRKETTASPSTVLHLVFWLGLRNAQHLECGPKFMNGLMPVKARPRTRSWGRTVLYISKLIWIQPVDPVSLIINKCPSQTPSVHDASNSFYSMYFLSLFLVHQKRTTMVSTASFQRWFPWRLRLGTAFPKFVKWRTMVLYITKPNIWRIWRGRCWFISVN